MNGILRYIPNVNNPLPNILVDMVQSNGSDYARYYERDKGVYNRLITRT